MENITNLRQIVSLNYKELKKLIGRIMGTNVNEILLRMYQSEKELVVKFRHTKYCYSEIHFMLEDNKVVPKLLNYTTKKLIAIEEYKQK